MEKVFEKILDRQLHLKHERNLANTGRITKIFFVGLRVDHIFRQNLMMVYHLTLLEIISAL